MYKEPELSVLILDYLREKEANLLIQSLQDNLKFRAKIIYLSNSPNCDYAKKFLDEGKIDQLIINKENLGCGISTRQLYHSAISKYVLYLQVDQILISEFNQEMFNIITSELEKNPNVLYCDLAGNQNHGKYSERASLMEKNRYLNIPDIDTIIAGPGPYANYKWGEQHVNEYIKENNLTFFTIKPLLFADNGKTSRRSYPCGGETLHFTDSKALYIIRSLKQRYDNFPNLNLNNEEWELVLSNKWINGTIPQNDLKHSFNCFNQETYTKPEEIHV